MDRPQRFIAVGGGKGGVGKSVISANLAIAMADAGEEVALVDADFGMANLHTMFGIEVPGPTLHDFIARKVETLEDTLLQTSVERLRIVPGSTAYPGSANFNHGQKQKLLRHLEKLPAATVILDVGAGLSFNVIDVFNVADVHLVVTTQQLTSIQNAYAFLKGAVHRTLRGLAATPEQRVMFDAWNPGVDTERLGRMVKLLGAQDPNFSQALEAELFSYSVQIVGNQFFNDSEENVLHALSRLSRDFLGIKPEVLGFLRASRRLHDSVTQRKPFLRVDGRSENASNLRAMARALLDIDYQRLRRGRRLYEVIAESPADGQPVEPDNPAEVPNALHRYTRRHERVRTDMVVNVEYEGHQYQGRVLDLSASGVQLKVACSLPVGAPIVIALERSKPPKLVRAPSVVRNVRSGGESFGVEFDQLNALPLDDSGLAKKSSAVEEAS